jgi:hypothetical protein
VRRLTNSAFFLVSFTKINIAIKFSIFMPLDILSKIAKQERLDIDPDINPYDPSRVFCYVANFYDNHNLNHRGMAMILYAGGDQINHRSIGKLFGIRNPLLINRASPEQLAQIGLKPGACHPFIDFGILGMVP